MVGLGGLVAVGKGVLVAVSPQAVNTNIPINQIEAKRFSCGLRKAFLVITSLLLKDFIVRQRNGE